MDAETNRQDQSLLPTSPDQLLDFLKELGIPDHTVSHPPLMTVEDSKALRGDLPGGHCKNLFLRDRKEAMWLVVTLEDRQVDLKQLGEKLGGKRLSFGSADRLMRYLGVLPGAVTPFSAINDKDGKVTVILDEPMLKLSPLNYHPLINDRTTAITPDDLIRFLKATGHEPVIMDIC